MDISGAFDNVRHKHIVNKIIDTGLEGCYVEVRQLLTERVPEQIRLWER